MQQVHRICQLLQQSQHPSPPCTSERRSLIFKDVLTLFFRTAIISPAHVIPPIPTNVTFTPRADYFFCSESRVSTALFELPGVKKTDLKIELSTCQNGVTQLSISGEVRRPLSDGITVLKERKYGKFRRVLPVRHDTKASRLSSPKLLRLKHVFSEGRHLRPFGGWCSYSSHTIRAAARV